MELSFTLVQITKLMQLVVTVVALALGFVLLLVKVPGSEYSSRLNTSKGMVTMSYFMSALIMGLTLGLDDIEGYATLSIISTLIAVSLSILCISFSMVNLLNNNGFDISKFILNLIVIVIFTIIVLWAFFQNKVLAYKISGIAALIAFAIQGINYIFTFQKWYKQKVNILEEHYDDDESHRIKWVRFCFGLAILTNLFAIVYVFFPVNFIFIYISFYVLYMVLFTSNFLSFLSSHKMVLDAVGYDFVKTLPHISRPKISTRRSQQRRNRGATEIEKALDRWVNEKRYCDFSLSREDILEELGTTRDEFQAYFNDVLQIDFRTWRTNLRIEEAKKMLLDMPKQSTRYVGERCGFSDRSNFYRQFTKIVGCTPCEWREQHKVPDSK